MFDRWRRKPLRLQIGERTVRFDSLSDFEFGLSSRTDLPASKVAALVQLGPETLEHEASSIRDVQRRFVDVLSSTLESPGSLGARLSEMDPKLFSHDHDWREIMAALTRQGAAFEDYKKMALVKYLQYLGSRQDVLQSIYTNKHVGAVLGETDLATGPAALRETVIFDVEAPSAAHAPPRFTRLPRGETVVARLGTNGTLDLVLSRHAVVIVGGEHPRLRDGEGREHPLGRGRNVVGRQPDCEVAMDGANRDVSRQHLMVDLREPGLVELTDLSSHGTFVPADALVPAEGR